MTDRSHTERETDPIEASDDKRPATFDRLQLDEDDPEHVNEIRGLVRALLQQGQRHG